MNMKHKQSSAMTWISAIAVVIAAQIACASSANTLHVPGDYPTIQDAIDAAANGDEIIVARGTYNETIDFLGKAVHLRSSDGPEVTIIDATGIGGSVVLAISGEGPDTILEGFTITGGTGTLHCDPLLPECIVCGGGMFTLEASPTVIGCVFDGNTAEDGGGMCILREGSPLIINCTFENNIATEAGGGMTNAFGTSPTVTDCVFRNNWGLHGGAMQNVSGGIVTTTHVMNCLFEDNSSERSGGAMVNNGNLITITNSTFQDNVVTAGASVHGGGAISAFQGVDLTLTDCRFIGNRSLLQAGGAVFLSHAGTVGSITNCLFVDNEANTTGGAVSVGANGGGLVSIVNTTFTKNQASAGGAVRSNVFGGATIANSILWANAPSEISGSANVTYSNVQGGFAGTGNINADPLFVDPANGNFRLGAGSPSIDAGDNLAVPDGIKSDLDGNPRFVDGNCDGSATVDMGAFEHQITPADLNCDGSVGVADLLVLIGAWGQCPECDDCPADLNGDCTVGVADLLILISNWG